MDIPPYLGDLTPASLGYVGEHVGPYTLVRMIGSGATAEVWEVQDVNSAKRLALKIHHVTAQSDWRTLARFEEEGSILGKLRHPNILEVFGVGQDGARAWIAMELATGGSLFAHVQREGPLTPSVGAALLIDVLEAVQCGHDAGIIHRDIKPQNIMLDAQGRVVLGDFGIARVGDARGLQLTEPATALGSMSYMPPEQRVDAREVTAASDVYACGATLFAIVANRSPADLHLTSLDHRRWERLHPLLRPIVQRATRGEPKDRYPSARAMADALAEVLPLLDPVGPAAEEPGGAGAADMDIGAATTAHLLRPR